ncbi:hypothetical protein [Anaerotignum lactatifermentans]|uniref:hypothetical protein n=1 Tax=Anaerotignum lactatifermentans TaxID=160404 RepID=UPI0024B0D9A1|nr:hypothetical protein [Anaerotignum lactatifermentans]
MLKQILLKKTLHFFLDFLREIATAVFRRKHIQYLHKIRRLKSSVMIRISAFLFSSEDAPYSVPVFFCGFLGATEAELLFFVANRAKLYYDCKEQVFCERMDDKVKGEK